MEYFCALFTKANYFIDHSTKIGSFIHDITDTHVYMSRIDKNSDGLYVYSHALMSGFWKTAVSDTPCPCRNTTPMSVSTNHR